MSDKTFTEAERLEFARTHKEQRALNDIHPMAKIHLVTEIGMNGFGWVRKEDGTLLAMPHQGNVVIEADVNIGAYSTVDRAVQGSTFIGEGTKIGHHVHVGHGAKIGKHCLIVDRVGIGGSATIGDYAYIGHGATIRNKVTIGAHAFIGQHSNVVCDVPEGETWCGNPAKKLR